MIIREIGYYGCIIKKRIYGQISIRWIYVFENEQWLLGSLGSHNARFLFDFNQTV